MSGRIGLWNTAIDFIKDRPFLGYGSMSDRDIINKKRIEENYLLNPVSNAFLYSILSGGIFCLILFLMFWWSIRNEIFNVLSLKKNSKRVPQDRNNNNNIDRAKMYN